MSEDMPSVPGGFAPGSRIAGYLLEEQIGQGGMAVVFRAHDERLDRTVALKILSPVLAADEAFRQRFIRESRAAAAVDDPHIIPVFEAGEASGVLFIAMRYVRGGDVRSMVSQFGPLPPGRVAEIISQVASALDAAHGRGLVHRDVKPANILLDASSGTGRPDHVYLSDFGLSKGSLQASGLTGTGTFLGTLDYISPEQIEGKPVDGRADEYALACAAFELLSGTPPFQRDEAMAVMYAQLSEPPPPLSSRRPDLPGAVDEVFAKALAKPPADRYGSCREFSEALREAFGIRPYDSGPGTVPSGQHQPTQVVRPTGGADLTSAAGGVAEAGTQAASWASSGPGGAGSGPAGGSRGGYGGPPVGGPPTQVAGGGGRNTSPDLTAAHWQEGPSGPYGGGRPRPRWRSPAALVAALVVLIAVVGGGAYLAFHHSAGKVIVHVAALTVPGCSTSAASGSTLSSVPSKLNNLVSGADQPFGVQVSRDGKFVFVVTSTTVQVLGDGPAMALVQKWNYTIASQPLTAKGATMTSDGKYLLVAAGNGIDVLSVADGEAGAGSMNVGTLTVPNVTDNGGAVEVAVSHGGQYAFVTLQAQGELAVFNLRKAITTGAFGSAAYVGSVSLGNQPVGMSISPNGQYLYVASFAAHKTSSASEGLLSVLSMAKAETDPASSVLRQVPAGCTSGRVLASPDGKTVWVTSKGSNYLLGFSAPLLISKPSHALVAKVQVGQNPTGMILVNGGTRMVVADTNDGKNSAASANNLAVVNISKALARKPALLGYIPSGAQPREFALLQGGTFLAVSNTGSNQVQVLDLGKLP